MIQRPKGTKDIYGDDQKIYSFIFDSFEQLTKSYNFKKITTPIFEYLTLFKDSSGETSDIIVKELYSFKDFSNRELALRPEGTAPVARAIIENKMLEKGKLNKLYYIGPMFRYENPQKGRMRQFYQIGTEIVGDNSIYTIIEIIKMGYDFLKLIGIDDFILKINNIGSPEERNLFQIELTKYFLKNKDQLSPLSQTRIINNPLRILDDKIDSVKDVVINAPKIKDFLSQESKNQFNQFLGLLDLFGITYQVDPFLVRGLDYYTNIVFEFISNSNALGSKLTIIGGGCYENLVKNSSQDIVGVGFGIGVERLFEILKQEKIFLVDQLDAYFLINNYQEFEIMFPIISKLRNQGFKIDFNKKYSKSKKIFADAMDLNPIKLVYFDQLINTNANNNLITIKDLASKIKLEVSSSQVIEQISGGIKNETNK